MERVTGIEPAWPAWKAGALPLSYTRRTVGKTCFLPAGGPGRRRSAGPLGPRRGYSDRDRRVARACDGGPEVRRRAPENPGIGPPEGRVPDRCEPSARRVTGLDREQLRPVRSSTRRRRPWCPVRLTARRRARCDLLRAVCDSAGWVQNSLPGCAPPLKGPRVAPTCDAHREDTRVAIRTAVRRLGAVRAEPASALVTAVPRLVLS